MGKDAQGTNIINPETFKIIRNLRQKALLESLPKEYYINQFLIDNTLNIHIERISPTRAFEKYAQEWCISQRIIGYDYIWNLSFAKEEGE